MTRTITFNELRKIKDSLPSGAIDQLAAQLGVTADTIRNYFGGENYKTAQSVGMHIEPGPDGGLVMLDDVVILEAAQKLIGMK